MQLDAYVLTSDLNCGYAHYHHGGDTRHEEAVHIFFQNLNTAVELETAVLVYNCFRACNPAKIKNNIRNVVGEV